MNKDDIGGARVLTPETRVDSGATGAGLTGSPSPFDALDVFQDTDATGGPSPDPVVSPRGVGRLHIDAVEPGSVLTRENPTSVRSVLDDWRTALHEAGHCGIGRSLGQDVAGCSIVPGATFGGMTWGPQHDRSMLSLDNEVPDLCEQINQLMPGPGEPRSDTADIYAHVHVRVVDLCAGTAAETLLHPDCEPWIAHSDIRQARALAGLICSSESAIDAYLMFALAEAKALIIQHRDVVLAIARALMVHRTLDAVMIHKIIALAPERARRAEWACVQQSAADFAARGLER
jgi:hypothetical protein